MIKIVAKVSIKKEKTDEFIAAAKALVEASKAEDGNISYSVNANVKEPGKFAFIEIWQDQAVLDRHMKTDHFLSAMAKMQDYTDAEMGLDIYTEL